MHTATQSNTMAGTLRRSGSVRAVKEAIRRVEDGADPCVEVLDQADHLDVLAERVRRLNRLGDVFAGVQLSPYVKRLRAAL